MKSGKTYRCYVVYIKGSVFDPEARRKGEYHWVAAGGPNRARTYVENVFAEKEMRQGESVEKIVATPFAEDQALRAQGIEGLPLDFGNA